LEDRNVVYTNFGPNDRQTVLQELFRLHAKRAVQKRVRSTFSQDNVMAFQKSLLDRLGPDQMWLRGLRHADEVIAIFCGYVAGGSIAYYQLGYDPAWAMFSPGS